MQTTPYIVDTPEAHMLDKYLMNLLIAVGGYMKWIITLTLSLIPLEKIPEIIYICISEPTNGAKDLVKGKNIVYLLYNR